MFMLSLISKKGLFYFKDGVKINLTEDNIPSNIRGDVTDIRGDVTNIRGYVSNIRGYVTDIRGNVTEARKEYFAKLNQEDNGEFLDIEVLVG